MKKRHAAAEEAYAAQVRGPPCPCLREPRAFHPSKTHDAQTPFKGKRRFVGRGGVEANRRFFVFVRVPRDGCPLTGNERVFGDRLVIKFHDVGASRGRSSPSAEQENLESLKPRYRETNCFTGLGPPS
jgi:hypothetical protein